MKRTTVKMKGKPCCPQPPVSIQILNGGVLAPGNDDPVDPGDEELREDGGIEMREDGGIELRD